MTQVEILEEFKKLTTTERLAIIEAALHLIREDFQQVNEQLQRVHVEQARRRERNEQIEKAVAGLFMLSKTWEDLWQKLEQMLQQVTVILGANHAAFLLHEISEDGARTTRIQITANMPTSIRKGQTYKKHDDLFDGWTEPEDVHGSRFEASVPDTLCWDLERVRSTTAAPLHTIVSVRCHLSDRIKGLIVFFFEERAAAEFNVDEEKICLNLISSRIAQAYHNTGTYMAQVTEEKQIHEWIRRVSHQIIAPLNGLIGHAGSLLERFERWRQRSPSRFAGWPEEDLARWHNALDSILWTADWAARLTRNLAWMAEPKTDRKKLIEADLETIRNVPDFLIECARFMQGAARERRLRMVHVDKDSVTSLNGRLRVYPDYFRQVLLNLLDNAVKYSNPGTEIIVDGLATNGHCRIRVTNYGIPLSEQDYERIFDYEFRTSEASRRYPAAAGIGLPVAREIVEMHGGTLTAEPSQLTSQGWRTTFTISLPLAK
ncbi:MAG: sensor histidine kinase [Anaerolineales bacterium]|nr:MAG: sensor histidine kinase [Anaerolineales bacterium]